MRNWPYPGFVQGQSAATMFFSDANHILFILKSPCLSFNVFVTDVVKIQCRSPGRAWRIFPKAGSAAFLHVKYWRFQHRDRAKEVIQFISLNFLQRRDRSMYEQALYDM